MQALRTRTACIARQTKTPTALRQPRRFASDHHHHAEPVNEPIGKGFWVSLAVIPTSFIVYSISQPGKGRPGPVAHPQDSLLLNTPSADMVPPLRALQNSAARNVVAGSQTNLDHVVAHYQKKHIEDEERKARKLAAEQQ
ncbi:conserved hypothetical protein [Verticillium alfalfae VaMs.102]|uniref:Uncharacterized protein n=1 Tax=Verticillium alfalfae (strain VaMs.102 / ATCC MYA-4576 / FGSC 10136) TaxID=526221 RepID=C9SMN5_VERA1|nr:conserved hypothetical protein [Verticillium alfalfae VaMs.102]EEY20050.1 conserved hypothetical protein [Verticillium alfalfae VaMs.102]